MTVAFSVLGNWRIGRLTSARRPEQKNQQADYGCQHRPPDEEVSYVHARLPLLFPRRQDGVAGGLHVVVNRDQRAVFELDLPARNDFVTFGDALQDGHLIAARSPVVTNTCVATRL